MALTEAEVKTYYQAILQREPTDAQLAVAMATGTADSLISALIDSNESQSFVFPLIQVYQAVFGRVPDAAGLDFWVDAYRAGTSLEDITAGFVASDEFQSTYGNVTDGSDPAFIQQLYINVLGRPGEPAGIAFWTSQTGISPADVVRLFATDVEFTNKAAGPIADFLTDAANGTQDYLGSLFEGGFDGETFTLTTGVDTRVGTENNDTFIGLQDTNADTFTVGDDIDGGAGVDTLRITTTGNASNAIDLSIAQITGIEKLELRINDDAFTDLDLGSVGSDLEALSMDFRGGEQSNDFEIEGINANAQISLSNIKTDGTGIDVLVELDEVAGNINGSMVLSNVDDLDVWVDVDTSADGSGDADVYSVTFDNVQNSNGNASWYITDVETLNVTVATASTLESIGNYYNNDGSDGPDPQVVNLQLNGDLSVGFWDFSDDEGPATLNITGAGDLFIEEFDDGDSQMVVAAAAATGNINIQDASSNFTSLNVTFGSGDDRLTIEDGADFSTITAAGGAGTDIFGVSGDDVANISQATLSGFETLEISSAATAAVAVDADDNGFDNLILGVDVTQNVTVEDLSGDLTIKASQAGVVTVGPEGASDDLAVSLDAGGAITLTSLDVSDYTSVDFTSASEDDDVTFTLLTADDVDTLSFAGEGDVTITASSTTGLDVLDLSALTGKFDGDAVDLGTDILVGNLGAGSVVYLDDPTAGNDGTNVLTFGSALDNAISFDGFEGGVGGDVLDLGALGVANFGALTIAQAGANVAITSDAFDGQITLLGMLTADLDGTANFVFA